MRPQQTFVAALRTRRYRERTPKRSHYDLHRYAGGLGALIG